jgi:hypothetical protein
VGEIQRRSRSFYRRSQRTEPDFSQTATKKPKGRREPEFFTEGSEGSEERNLPTGSWQKKAGDAVGGAEGGIKIPKHRRTKAPKELSMATKDTRGGGDDGDSKFQI